MKLYDISKNNNNIFFDYIYIFFIISVRLANIMKELQLLPYQIHETEACRVSLYIHTNIFWEVNKQLT